MDEEKGGYILAECFWFIIEGAFWGYFTYVCYKFEDTYYPEAPEEDEETAKEENKDGEKNKQE